MTSRYQHLNDLGQPMTIARSAEIYDLGNNKVLKLFHANISDDAAKWEFRNATEAYALDEDSSLLSRIKLHGEVSIDGRYGIIMDFINGKTLTQNIEKNPLRVVGYSQRLAKTHVAMHAMKADGLRDIREIISAYLDDQSMQFLSTRQKAACRRYLSHLPKGNALIHMDFHTDNVLVTPYKDIAIDWATGAKGDRSADLAMTYFLFNEAELYPGISKFQEVLYSLFRRTIYKAYFKHYAALAGVSQRELNNQMAQWKLAILIARLVTCQAPSEIDVLQRKISSLIEDALTTPNSEGESA